MATPVRPFTMAAAGHSVSGCATMYEPNDHSGMLLKPLDAAELEVYQQLSTRYAEDSIRSFTPGFYGVEHSDDLEEDFIRLENLLHGLSQPMVMDVKLGMRTHLLAETRNEKPRGDLFKKMLKDFPTHLTPAEISTKTVTKSRYMSVKDAESTTGSLGYRVCGVADCNNNATSFNSKSASETEKSAFEAFRQLTRRAANGSKDEAWISERVVEQLKQLRSAMEASTFVKQHECVGSSLLLVIDASSGYCRASWIDFAKTCVCEQAIGLCHRESPHHGSQEDGLFVGLDNLISAWECICHNLNKERAVASMHSSPICGVVSFRRNDEAFELSRRFRSWHKNCWPNFFVLKTFAGLMFALGHIIGALADESLSPGVVL